MNLPVTVKFRDMLWVVTEEDDLRVRLTLVQEPEPEQQTISRRTKQAFQRALELGVMVIQT